MGRFSDDELELASSVRRTVSRRLGESLRHPWDTPVLPRELWEDLGTVGLWQSMLEPDFPASGLVVLASRELGAALVPGPVAATFGALRLLDDERAEEVAAGTTVVAVGVPERVAWGLQADLVLVADGERYLEVEPGRLRARTDLVPGTWAACVDDRDLAAARSLRDDPVGAVRRTGQLADLGYVSGAAQASIAIANEHARTRTQFGRPIGDFQAVSHQLVDATLALQSAESTLVTAARLVDERRPADAAMARATLAVAGSARRAVAASHQVLGAIGYTLEGPLAGYTRTIQQRIAMSLNVPEARRRVADSLQLGGTNLV